VGRHPGDKIVGWSPDECERLRREIKDGVPLQDIAAAHGRSVLGIINKMLVLGIVVHRDHKYFMVAEQPWATVDDIKKLTGRK
jgi:hypothetical protein